MLRKWRTISEYGRRTNMIPRILRLPHTQSFFLFGARNTGKSTLLKHVFAENCFWIDLLDPVIEEQYARDPNKLKAQVLALPEEVTHIVIDEVQKIPKLLDVVHYLIENSDKKFVMSGSSARKLKRGGANLLAGRAGVFHLFPFSYIELDTEFDLSVALHWGFLPSIYHSQTNEEKTVFLQAYANVYLKEEIWSEQFIRNLDPFRRFLEVSAQSNGKVINYSNIAKDVGVDDKTVKNYYSILEDTLLGFFLEPFHSSFRKRLNSKPKFYFFDVGIVRALARQLSLPVHEGTSYYGDIFESLIIIECIKLAKYFKSEYRFSYLSTKDNAEVDLVVERPGKPILFIEIKSAAEVSEHKLSRFKKIVQDFGDCEAVCIANTDRAAIYGNIKVLPWQEALQTYFVDG